MEFHQNARFRSQEVPTFTATGVHPERAKAKGVLKSETRVKAEAQACVGVFSKQSSNGHDSRHVPSYSNVTCRQGEHSQSERKVCVPHRKESWLARMTPSHKVG
eukprot:6186824-Pleurochrysis_carterae.AAC.1